MRLIHVNQKHAMQKCFSGVKIDGYTNGTGYYKHIDCQGTESSLSDCTVTDNSGCRDSHGDSVGVRCTMESEYALDQINRVFKCYTIIILYLAKSK